MRLQHCTLVLPEFSTHEGCRQLLDPEASCFAVRSARAGVGQHVLPLLGVRAHLQCLVVHVCGHGRTGADRHAPSH